MARPELPPFLHPCEPVAGLGWSMQKLRRLHGWSTTETGKAFGCSASHISRVEHGKMPSRELVRFYEETFEAEGLLLSLYEVAVDAPEQSRRGAGGKRPKAHKAVPGDASMFVDDTVPHGQLMQPSALFLKDAADSQ